MKGCNSTNGRQGVAEKDHVRSAKSLPWINQKVQIKHTSTLGLSSLASSSCLHITSSEEDLPKAAAVTQQTKALISRKPLPLPVVLKKREEKGKSDSAPRILSSLHRLRDKQGDETEGKIIFRASPISRAIEERKWSMSLGGLESSNGGRSILLLAKGLAPWICE